MQSGPHGRRGNCEKESDVSEWRQSVGRYKRSAIATVAFLITVGGRNYSGRSVT
jgi:hypothetical protein